MANSAGEPKRASAQVTFPIALVLLAVYERVLFRSLEEKRGEEGERAKLRDSATCTR